MSGFREECAGDPGGLLLQPGDYRDQVLKVGAELVSSGAIRELDMNDSSRFPELLSIIGPSPVESVHLRGWRITPELSQRLGSLQKLRHLTLDNTEETADLLEHIPRLKSLSLGILAALNHSGRIWSATANLKHLENLTLSYKREEESLEAPVHLSFLRNHPRLRTSSLYGINPVDLSVLQTNSSLEEIYLKAVDASLDLSPLCSIPKLRVVHWGELREPTELSPIAKKVKILVPKERHHWDEKRWFPLNAGAGKEKKKTRLSG